MAEKLEDHLDSSFMAVRRNSNFMSLLICFLITTNPDMGELAFLGFKFSAFNLTAVWAWILVFWLYFFYRYWQFNKEVGITLLNESYSKAEMDLYPNLNFVYNPVNQSKKLTEKEIDNSKDIKIPLDRYRVDSGSFTKVSFSHFARKEHFQLESSKSSRDLWQTIKIEDFEKWKTDAVTKAHLERPALLTLKAPKYLFILAIIMIFIKLLCEAVLFFVHSTVPPIFHN